MAKKKNKQVIRPWCWYCEREFEDEKVLMQHQKAKHFKCNMCPRRLNTAGGLAVHIQQVHKLEPENLPRIENALPGRDGYEVEIFGMEGIPAPDVADYKRRKEIELGLAAGSISQPPPKRAKVDNRPLSEDELRRQLEEHKALMGITVPQEPAATPAESSSGAVYGAPQTYATPPIPTPGLAGVTPIPTPPFIPPPPGAFPGAPPPFPPFMPGFPPGPPPPGFPMAPPPFPPGAPPFPPGGPMGRPPFPPPPFMPPPGMSPPGPPGAFSPPNPLPPPQFVPAQNPSGPPVTAPAPALPPHAPSGSQAPPAPSHPEPLRRQEPRVRQPVLTLPNGVTSQTNPEFKKATDLKFKDANFSPEEHRAIHPKYFYANLSESSATHPEESRGKKRARAEDFL
ncbi:hypothetical protein CPB84DRAFT_1749847 [Gymnopilus junonius]|uniref:C2H2-type domain-containing protein n=1 Tax=Gymnopilus junonius TaxID=109634 RepID=A0A9P5NGT7_GYMJU|nr:hypothetical protein CPB84DRAFT_1749847 [Gymnopilus junonius]